MNKVAIYVATHNKHIDEIDECRIPIQVGAAVATERFQAVADDQGDNISKKNANYCELTALYWIWKNSDAGIVGLEHYRRCFDIDEAQIQEVLTEYDIILPTVYRYRWSLEEEYNRYHLEDDWKHMKEALNEKSPDVAEDMMSVFGSNEIIPYNMFICKKRLCDEYSKWLFDILADVEGKHIQYTPNAYQERYLGFLSERLFTLYIRLKGLRVYTCKVKECEKSSLIYTCKNWIGQHVWNPMIFMIRKKGKR